MYDKMKKDKVFTPRTYKLKKKELEEKLIF